MDVFARTGGEEFLLVVPGASRKQIRQMAHRLKDSIASQPIYVNDKSLDVTASFGVAHIHATPQPDFERLFKQADEYAYEAKRTGRNRVVSQKYLPQNERDGSEE